MKQCLKLAERIIRKASVRQIAGLAVILYLISLIPILMLSGYAYPGADDFGYGAACHQIWLQTHSVFQTVKEAFLTAVDRYDTWQGTFSSVFLFALQPAVWDEKMYFITTWVMVILLTAGVWSIMKAVAGRCFGADRGSVCLMAVIVLFFTMQCMVEPVQGLFWYNGAVHYIVMHSAYLLLSAMQIGQLKKEKCHWWEVVISACLAFFISGGNYITALLYGITIVTFAVVLLAEKKYRKLFLLIGPFVVFAAGFILNVAAPGNAVRQANFTETPGVISSVLISFSDCLKYTMGEWADWRVVCMVVFLLPAVLRIVRRTSFRFRYPLLVILYSYCCLSAMFAPTVYATGSIGAGRIHNIIYAMFLLLLALDEIYIAGWLVQQGYLSKSTSQRNRYVFSWILLTGICLMGIQAVIAPETFTSAAAMETIRSGEAESFRAVNMERRELLHSGQRELELPRYECIPVLLYMDDISVESDWKSDGMCRFYDKDSILLEPRIQFLQE